MTIILFSNRARADENCHHYASRHTDPHITNTVTSVTPRSLAMSARKKRIDPGLQELFNGIKGAFDVLATRLCAEMPVKIFLAKSGRSSAISPRPFGLPWSIISIGSPLSPSPSPNSVRDRTSTGWTWLTPWIRKVRLRGRAWAFDNHFTQYTTMRAATGVNLWNAAGLLRNFPEGEEQTVIAACRACTFTPRPSLWAYVFHF